MSKIFFIGNTESPYFGEIVQKIVLTGNDLIMNLDSYKQLLRLKLEKDFDYASIKTWSCDDNFSDYHVKSQIRGLFPFLYPDTIDRHAMKRLLNLSTQAHRGLGGFRLGFGVQEELFDLFRLSLKSSNISSIILPRINIIVVIINYFNKKSQELIKISK